MNPAVRVENVSKCYRLRGNARAAYHTLRDTLATTPRRIGHWLQRTATPHLLTRQGVDRIAATAASAQLFWALRDVSLEIRPGEIVGVIGPNGAGKSTLLKILARITEPTRGRVELRGRVGSLLEVGTGFHPELTGRENIYLNGAILGMSRREIAARFGEITAFAEVDGFLDTPVKHYSSGMYVRLAFAVAAHLEPEILLIDEVLAVGDLAFQKKCLGHMAAIARSARTIFFVSHNLAVVQNLCEKVLVLSRGRPTFYGDTAEGIRHYMAHSLGAQTASLDLHHHPQRRPGAIPLLRAIRLRNGAGDLTARFASGESLTIEFDLDPIRQLHQPELGVGVDDWFGARVFSVTTYLSASKLAPIDRPCTVVCELNELALAPGRYTLSLSAGTPQETLLDAIDHALCFEVEPSDYFGNGKVPGPQLGRVLVRSQWKKN